MSTASEIDEILGRATSLSLTDNDVVFGRGGFTNRHPANIEYLKLISEHEEAYMNCKRKYQKLLSLGIIHQLRCKGARFLKKDEKTGSWQSVKLTQCRLKISQRLRERAPIIKLEQMKVANQVQVCGASRQINTVIGSGPKAFLATLPRPTPPVEIIEVTDVSSDEEDDGTESIGFDEDSWIGEGIFSFSYAFEHLLAGDNPFDRWAEEPIRTPESALHGKRFAESMFATEEPQRKRRKVSMDNQDYANMLLKEASLMDDITVSSFNYSADDYLPEQGCDEIVDTPSFMAPSDEMLDYLQVLF